MKAFRIHPLAHVFPDLTPEQFDNLKQDLTRNGLLEAITLYEEQVLDGRHRYRICCECGIPMRFAHYRGDNPLAYVTSKNFHRRHMTPGQRAMVAAEIKERLSETVGKELRQAGRVRGGKARLGTGKGGFKTQPGPKNSKRKRATL